MEHRRSATDMDIATSTVSLRLASAFSVYEALPHHVIFSVLFKVLLVKS